MIYVTGDIHDEIQRFQQLAAMKLAIHANDYMIICGDFGLIWHNPPSAIETKKLDWLASQPYTFLFVDGNHENFSLLRQFPIKKWNGGSVQPIRPNVLHLMRGELYTIENHTFFTFGGAASTDKIHRIPYVSWWPDENPTTTEITRAIAHLDTLQWQVDYVVTHTAPQHWKTTKLGRLDWDVCPTALFLEDIEKRLTYRNWFFGHMHRDDHGPHSKDQWLYEDIVHLDGTTAGRLPLDLIESQLPVPLQEALRRYHHCPITTPDNAANRKQLRRIIIEHRKEGTINDETAGRLVEEYCY
ncbi:MAG: metallophosphoesterase [Megasphaera sp.]|jgi:hypothetical protein|nr:metallophosphoesterase [Megasphaera sp.]MCH4188149.1 metallophosphoesterase [Megasphaera sp.]MCH4217987.1 metallophosphoesterase [Megasphaera sp.]